MNTACIGQCNCIRHVAFLGATFQPTKLSSIRTYNARGASRLSHISDFFIFSNIIVVQLMHQILNYHLSQSQHFNK